MADPLRRAPRPIFEETLSSTHEQVLVNLLYFNCVPILTYACNVKEYPAREMSDCNVAVNNALQKVFGFSTLQSIREIRKAFGFKSLNEIFKNAKDRFYETAVLIIIPLSLSF